MDAKQKRGNKEVDGKLQMFKNLCQEDNRYIITQAHHQLFTVPEEMSWLPLLPAFTFLTETGGRQKCELLKNSSCI